jgi:hypothetical protein
VNEALMRLLQAGFEALEKTHEGCVSVS